MASTEQLQLQSTRFWSIGSIALMLILAAMLRFNDLEADPPPFLCLGSNFIDESWQHEARNKALWGTWHLPNDNWNTSLVTSPSNALTYLSYKTFGISTWSLRVMPAALGVITVLLLALTAWLVWGRRSAIVAALTSAVALPLILQRYLRSHR